MDEQGAWEASTLAKTVLMKLGISEFDKPVGLLSGGQRKRVAMARVLIRPADLLILDEPTNHIDNETAIWLEEFLSKWRGALLLVTHDRYFLERVTTRILELDRGKIYSYEGNYEWFLEKKAERMDSEAASEDKRQNLLRRELAWLRRGAKARTTKQKARINRAEDLRDRKVDGPGDKLDMALAGSRLGKKVMELDDISKVFPRREAAPQRLQLHRDAERSSRHHRSERQREVDAAQYACRAYSARQRHDRDWHNGEARLLHARERRNGRENASDRIHQGSSGADSHVGW